MEKLGFNGSITEIIKPSDYEGFELARVIVEHKERYVVQTASATYNAEITGNLRYAAASRKDYPAVGDWVKIMMMDKDTAIIMEVFPRISVLERQAIGKVGEVQIIATNIDFGFIVQAVGHDFNLKRLERYLSICYSAKITPILLLTKTDLIEEDELEELILQVTDRIKDVELIPLSIVQEESFNKLSAKLEAYKTYCFMGSSGVGKSTIVNKLLGKNYLETKEVSMSTSKGKHTTSHRELILLPNDSIVIDTPGMRELGMTDNAEGIALTYQDIEALTQQCKFNDCSHTNEKGCAVLQAVDDGELSESVYDNYMKLRREEAHYSSSVQEKRQKSKELGKLYKNIMKEKKLRSNK